MIIFWECNLNFYFFVDLSSDQLLLESRNERTRSDCQWIVLTFSTFECNTVNESFEIKCNIIFICYSSVCNLNDSCMLLTNLLDLLVNFLLCYSCRVFVNFKSFVLSKFNFRFNCNFCCEDEWFSLLKLNDINCRLGSNLKFTLIICFCICLRNHAVCCLIIKYFRSVHLLDHLTRNFSFTESWEADFAALF